MATRLAKSQSNILGYENKIREIGNELHQLAIKKNTEDIVEILRKQVRIGLHIFPPPPPTAPQLYRFVSSCFKRVRGVSENFTRCESSHSIHLFLLFY